MMLCPGSHYVRLHWVKMSFRKAKLAEILHPRRAWSRLHVHRAVDSQVYHGNNLIDATYIGYRRKVDYFLRQPSAFLTKF
jgi:hypothetical protein